MKESCHHQYHVSCQIAWPFIFLHLIHALVFWISLTLICFFAWRQEYNIVMSPWFSHPHEDILLYPLNAISNCQGKWVWPALLSCNCPLMLLDALTPQPGSEIKFPFIEYETVVDLLTRFSIFSELKRRKWAKQYFICVGKMLVYSVTVKYTKW